MAAYALSSLLTGVAFLALGLLKMGNLRLTRGATRSPYYVSVFLLFIPAVFWIAVRARGIPHEHLVATGWLFTVDSVSSSPAALVASWNYWTLFDFNAIEWTAVKSAIQNIVLLVVIGVLNLPIYVPTLAFTLDVSYDMNHELLGQAAGNIFAGIVGTVPNILQYSFSVYVTRAKGGRFELLLISLLEAALFFGAGRLLPYVPTILASALVLFIGIELALEAVWEASKTLAGMEYAVVIGTLVGCTFLGFAEGFGVGIGAAAVVYLVYGVIDSPARVTRWNEWNELQQVKNQDEHHVAAPLEGRIHSPHNHTPAPINLGEPLTPTATMHDTDLKAPGDVDADLLQQLDARVLTLSGYIFFASVPSLEQALLRSLPRTTFFILDLSRAHRIETAAARVLPRCARDLRLKDSVLLVCGVPPKGGLAADFTRAEVELVFGCGEDGDAAAPEAGIPAFETREKCIAWCQREHQRRALCANKLEGLDDEARDQAFEAFCRTFNFQTGAVLGPAEGVDTAEDGYGCSPLTDVARFIERGGRIAVYLPGQAVRGRGVAFILEGQVDLVISTDPTTPDDSVLRPSIQRLLAMVPRETLRAVRARLRLPAFFRAEGTHAGRRFKAGDVLDLTARTESAVARTRSVIVEVEGEKLLEWARTKLQHTQADA
ncbi:hypothetical protein C8R47DRAFT_1162310 [Mycena vitilis]|nr:hypothetical protein C8R47DRAFT_1162310 [Mycena vitilis]